MHAFTSMKKRVEWVASRQRWEEVSYNPPVRQSEAKIGSHTYVKVETLHAACHKDNFENIIYDFGHKYEVSGYYEIRPEDRTILKEVNPKTIAKTMADEGL